jgi:hypothetical protein
MNENPYQSPLTPPAKRDPGPQRSLLWRLQFDPFYVGSFGLPLILVLIVVAVAVTALVFR